jgi:hypothetical protein
MAKPNNASRRRFVVSAGAVLAYSALPIETAAATKTGAPGPQAFAIPDYDNNPFLRPVGGPHTAVDPPRPTPPPTSGNGVGP